MKLTTEDIARAKGVTPETVRRWARRGLIEPCDRLPHEAGLGRMLFDPSELEKLNGASTADATDAVRDAQNRARARRAASR